MENESFSVEELNRYIEEQKKKVEEMLANMTPEERLEAEKRFAAAKEEDEVRLRKTLEDAREVMNMNTEHTAAYPDATVTEHACVNAENSVCLCPNCGAKSGGGKFCEYCGSRLK